MNKLFQYSGKFRQIAAGFVRHRHLYRSTGAAVSVMFMKLAATRLGRQFFRDGIVTIHLRDVALPVQLRQRTSDVLVFTEIFEEGVYQPVKRWNLPANAYIVDLGGNIGLATRYFSDLLPCARFVVVEPDEGNRQLLKSNCRGLIEDGRLSVIGAFVGATDGTAGIDRSGDSWTFRKAVETPGPGERIDCLSMPSLLRRTGLEAVTLLKCDIEGSETDLFRDCSKWIHAVQYLIVETHAPYSLKSLYEDLRKAGWNFKVLKQNDGLVISHCFLERFQ